MKTASDIVDIVICIFFFQAEDGIRDGRVTGVQTCALPIFYGPDPQGLIWIGGHADGFKGRSEERRVGKECRSRWSPYQPKKNTSTACRTALWPPRYHHESLR